VALYTFSLRWRELWLLGFGVGLTLNAFLNGVLVVLIADRVPIEGCGGPYDLPSRVAQHAAFFITSILTYSFQYRSPHFHGYYQAALAFWALIVPYALVYFNFNSGAQLLAAALVGSVFAFVWQVLVMYYLLAPHFDVVTSWWAFKTLEYRDTWCRVAAEDVALEAHYDALP
jgi:hypothetical protein